MHYSRLCAVLIDCKTSNVDEAANFWGEALGRAVDAKHPGSRGNCRMLETPPDEPVVQIQRVDHDSRVHIDIESLPQIPESVTYVLGMVCNLCARKDNKDLDDRPSRSTDPRNASGNSTGNNFRRPSKSASWK